VSNDDGQCAQFFVRPLDGFQHDNAGAHIQSACRLVT
jgi:hypothetical protein